MYLKLVLEKILFDEFVSACLLHPKIFIFVGSEVVKKSVQENTTMSPSRAEDEKYGVSDWQKLICTLFQLQYFLVSKLKKSWIILLVGVQENLCSV